MRGLGRVGVQREGGQPRQVRGRRPRVGRLVDAQAVRQIKVGAVTGQVKVKVDPARGPGGGGGGGVEAERGEAVGGGGGTDEVGVGQAEDAGVIGERHAAG